MPQASFIVAVHVTGCDLPDSELSAEEGKERRIKKLNLNPRPLNHEVLALPLCYNHCPSIVTKQMKKLGPKDTSVQITLNTAIVESLNPTTFVLFYMPMICLLKPLSL